MRRSIATGLKIVLFLTIPSALGLCMLAGPIVQTLFERGAFTPEATVLCASLLPFAAVGLVAVAANIILTRYLFACGAVKATIVLSVATVVVNVLLSILWLPSLGARGLLLANAVSQTLQTFALGVVVWRQLRGFDVRGVPALRVQSAQLQCRYGRRARSRADLSPTPGRDVHCARDEPRRTHDLRRLLVFSPWPHRRQRRARFARSIFCSAGKARELVPLP